MTASLTEQVFQLSGWSDAWRTELRGPHGEWIGGTGRYKLPDPERLVLPPGKPGRKNYYPRPEDHPFFKAHPVSAASITAAYDATSPAQRAQGARWYSDVHNLATKIADGDSREGAILLAAYSPQVSWPINLLNASRAADEHRALGPGEGLITGAQQRQAQKALDGAPIDDVLKGPKTRAFGHLIEHGDDSADDPAGRVVIDTHALNVATGGNALGKELDGAPIDSPRYHEYVADQYRASAQQISKRDGTVLKPHQLQAITWLAQQQANQAIDAAAAEKTATAKGRIAMTKNAWARWLSYARIHNIPLQAGVTALAATILAQVAELIGGDTISGQLDLAYNPLQPRDTHGRWARGPGPPWEPAHGGMVTFHGSLGIDRAAMPQLSGIRASDQAYVPPSQVLPAFAAHLRAQGVPVTEEHVLASSLHPSQATGDERVIHDIAGELASGKLADTKPIVISSDNRVIDGHHTWAGRLLADMHTGQQTPMPVVRIGLPAGQAMAQVRSFAASQGLTSRAAGVMANPEYADSLAVHGGPGGLSPGRAALHQKIISEALAGHHSQQHPVATFLGGGTASGKSTMLAASHSQAADSVHIDPDAIKAKLPEYQQMKARGDHRAASYVHEESSLLAREITTEAQKRHYNLTLDGTGDSDYAKLAGKVSSARAAGYQTTGKYVTTDTDEAIRRARARAGETGRMVPEPVMREIHASVSGAYRQAAQQNLFDHTELWDNNGSAPQMIASKLPGGQFTVHDQAAWQRFLAKEHQ
jgi:predicted ABC-type ATPase